MAIAPVATTAQTQPQCWDFGAEQLAGYDNKLTADIINGWQTPNEPGTNGVSFNSKQFGSEDYNLFFLNPNGKALRIRTTNTNLTRYDPKSLQDEDGNTYTGYIYVNGGAVNIGIKQHYPADAKIETWVGSNGKVECYCLESQTTGVDYKELQKYSQTGKAELLTWYVKEEGDYFLHTDVLSTGEAQDKKLVVARIVLTQAQQATVQLTISHQEALPTGAKIRFTQRQSKSHVDVDPNATTVQLVAGRDYDLSLVGANNYVISQGAELLDVPATGGALTVATQPVVKFSLSGNITGLDNNIGDLAVTITKPNDKIFQPQIAINTTNKTYSVELEEGVTYSIEATGVNDYTTTTTSFGPLTADATADIAFQKKATHAITINTTPENLDLSAATITFTNAFEEGYEYSFTGTSDIQLRDATYYVNVTGAPDNYKQMLTSAFKVNGADVAKTIDFELPASTDPVAYEATLAVGSDKPYKTINEALAYVDRMTRTAGQRVTINIDPGNYEEMIYLKANEVTFNNAAAKPSIALANKGVDIDNNAVRITSYYGHGYNYASMNKEGLYDQRLRDVNKANASLGLPAFTYPNSNSYWCSTVVIEANDFIANNIIFENSYNQYISQREVDDLVSKADGNKGTRPTTLGNTDVQDRTFRERACAFATAKNNKSDRTLLNNCRVVGRQDALYVAAGRLAINKGALMGACDYIMGEGVIAAYKVDLELLTTTNKDDVAHITAPHQGSATDRGFLFYECNVASAKPEVDMASTQSAIPGDFGRPWTANTGEAVFFKTTIGTTTDGTSLIRPEGWNNSLSGSSARCVEFASKEKSTSAAPNRADWATTLMNTTDENKLAGGTVISLYNFTKGADEWDPFNAKDDANEVVTVADALKTLAINTIAPDQANTSTASVTYRSLNGTLLDKPARGLNIASYNANGKTVSKLILVK